MKEYLLDTNICIFYMKGLYDLKAKFQNVNSENCLISEITLAELKFGVESSEKIEKNQMALNNFLTNIKIIPIFQAIDYYAKEKSRLRRSGKIVDDFDLLIGATAVTFGLKMVTNNTNHFDRIKGIELEDWTK
ncbi:MAG: type II toxin-antitoxin system VapC family toxin [Cryomorphaceae bacterium]